MNGNYCRYACPKNFPDNLKSPATFIINTVRGEKIIKIIMERKSFVH